MKRTRAARGRGIPETLLAEMAEALKVLAHPKRLRIVELLDEDAAAPVHRIVGRLGLPQASVSHHLNTMRRAALIAAERRGREMWYRVSNPHALTLLNCMRRKAEAE